MWTEIYTIQLSNFYSYFSSFFFWIFSNPSHRKNIIKDKEIWIIEDDICTVRSFTAKYIISILKCGFSVLLITLNRPINRNIAKINPKYEKESNKSENILHVVAHPIFSPEGSVVDETSEYVSWLAKG